ncbi:hypothetical protein ACLVWU_12385 [Bdellovibrio sp. HCB290]|uniref:hypothetical protein n=1 Tax=Bdellovibrio sp. HCB290 TaxID=3394356 RepID=UPI0039B472B6
MLRRSSKILLPLLIGASGLQARAMDTDPYLMQEHVINNAVQLHVTARGMNLFDTKLSKILGNLGVKLDEGYFPALAYTFEKPINPDDYAQENGEAVKMYKQVRDLLTKWLVGFSLKDHRPTIEIGESGFVANFSRFSLVTDRALMEKLGKREGAILAIELEVKHLTIGTNSVKVWDVNNEFLGKIGAEDVSLSAGDDKHPLKIRLPFYLRMNAYGHLEFEALDVENNLDTIPVSLEYKKLLVPTFAIEINGKKFLLNNAEIDKMFIEQAPAILTSVRENLGNFARTQLPTMLNEKAKQFLAGNLDQVQNMVPPGKEPNDNRPDFKWGLRLQNIGLNDSLNVFLGAYAEDPINPRSTPRTKDKSRGAVTWGLVPQPNYDIGLSLDRGLINRIMQLSFERRNFEKIAMSDGSTLRMMAAPLIDYVKAPVAMPLKGNETFVKLRVSVENKPDSIFLKEKIVVEFDIIAKLRQMADKSGMQLVLYSIDPETLAMDDKYFSLAGKLLKGKVREGIKDKLREQCAGWKNKDEAIPGAFPLPPEILGLKLDINRVIMDPNGHLVMYLDYAKAGAL